MFKDCLKHVLFDCNRNCPYVHCVKLYDFVNLEIQVGVRTFNLLNILQTYNKASTCWVMLIIALFMVYQLIYNHSSCVWMLTSLYRCAHNMLCRFLLNWSHCTWNVDYNIYIERERRVIYTDLHSLCICIYLYVCFDLYCSLYVYCIHVIFTFQYNGGNEDVYI